MTTVADLLKDSLIEVGSITPDESLTANESDHAMRVMNRMIQQWNAEGCMVYTLNRDLFSFIVGQQSYTLGTGGNFNISRPVKIAMASVQDSSLARPVEIPLNILTDDEWRGVAVKATPSVFPTQLWIAGNVPLNTLWFWPIPQSATYQLVLYSWGKTADYTAVTDTVTFPSGYEEAIVTNLAIRLAASYGKPADQGLHLRAQNAKALIATINDEPLYATSDMLMHGGSSKAIQSFGLVVD
jgi:hypothetical protein